MANSDRIVGGQFAPANIPWQAQVHIGTSSYMGKQFQDVMGKLHSGHYCGATILDAKTILSAAHCFFAGPKFIQSYKLPEKYHGKKFIDAMEPTIRVGFTDFSIDGDWIKMQVGINQTRLCFYSRKVPYR